MIQQLVDQLTELQQAKYRSDEECRRLQQQLQAEQTQHRNDMADWRSQEAELRKVAVSAKEGAELEIARLRETHQAQLREAMAVTENEVRDACRQ